MQLAKYSTTPDGPRQVGLLEGDLLRPLAAGESLSSLLHAPDPIMAIRDRARDVQPIPLSSATLWPPIDDQEVWGAGVTYERSKVARQEESEAGGSFYDQVYTADRPELFFKATPSRVVGPGQAIRVRYDSHWTVPEPELALVISPDLRLVGFTIGNDVSARDIEGKNPLYLPQAKVYEGCCALGPAVTLASAMPPVYELEIDLRIERLGTTLFEGSTSTARLARRFEDLIAWLGRENRFPHGAILLTGTGIVPPDEISLRDSDSVQISIEGIGSLVNPVVQRTAPAPGEG